MDAIRSKLAEKANPPTESLIKGSQIPLSSPTEKMLAAEWHGDKDVRVVEHAKPLVTDPTDAIVRMTSTTICGSDLHLYHNQVPGVGVMKPGDIMGHEAMGIVDSVGPGVKNLKPGDRVVISFGISCGDCEYCHKEMPTCCDTTNPSKQQETLWGHRTAGLFGYSHLCGGYWGCQAEFIRVPFADCNTLKVENSDLTDEQLILLSDVLCTGWHGNELAEVKEGDVVCVWGCGPIGLASLAWAKFRGATKIIGIDKEPYRLAFAKEQLGAEVINFDTENVIETIQKLVPGGPDVCIECAGFRFPKSFKHKVQTTMKLETDTMDILNEMIYVCKKGGRISVIGDYFGTGNGFMIGALMEKSIRLQGGQAYVQKYWHKLLNFIQSGKFDPTIFITHTCPLSDAGEAYKMFDQHKDDSLKIILKPSTAVSSR